MTSRYGDVYLRALAVSSSRSILLNSMEYGLRRGIGTSRSRVCQTKRKSTLKIRHYIDEHEYLVSSDDTHLSMGRGVSAAILKAAGPNSNETRNSFCQSVLGMFVSLVFRIVNQVNICHGILREGIHGQSDSADRGQRARSA